MWERNILAVEIQRQTGIHATTISKIINGKLKNFGLETIVKLCEVLNCRIQNFIEYVKINK